MSAHWIASYHGWTQREDRSAHTSRNVGQRQRCARLGYVVCLADAVRQSNETHCSLSVDTSLELNAVISPYLAYQHLHLYVHGY